MKYIPRPYQETLINFAIDHPSCGLFADMGLGKTAVTLTAVQMLKSSFEIRRPLVIAPKLVTEQTWLDEMRKWDHLQDMTISRIIGTEQERIEALHRKADLHAISRDNVAWMVRYLVPPGKKRKLPFDALIIDELSSFKNHEAKRFKAVKKMVPHVERVIGLTGTPAPNSLIDLWAQIYLLDQGERLGRTLTEYRNRYFLPRFDGYGYDLREGVEQEIYDKISDICISMSTADHRKDLPEIINIVRKVPLPNLQEYKDFEEKMVLEVPGGVITAVNAGALYSKLLQFCNGAVYDEEKNTHSIQDAKLEWLLDDVDELQGKPVIIFYQFQSDKARIARALKTHPIKTKADIDKWNRGEIPIALAHAASIGHGLNLQHGGSTLMWFGVPWPLELYQQAVKRIHRDGQKETVRNIHYLTQGTIEEIMLPRLGEKADRQDRVMAAFKRII